MDKQQEPCLRFKGYVEKWNVWRLGAFGKATGGTSLESEFCETGEYKVISIGSYSEESTYTDQGIRVNKNDKTEKKILNENDLTMILNDKTSSGRIIGRVLLIDQNDTYVYNQRTQRIEIDRVNFIPLFLYHFLNAENIRQKVIFSAQGNTQIYVNWSSIKNLEYFIPSTKTEQTHLGLFFRCLDSQIAESRAVLEKSRQLKKAMLAKMFPTNGEKIPEIRFKGFDGEWEYRKLGEVASSYSGGTPSVGNSKFYGGNIPFIRSGEIHSSKTELFLTQEGLENSSAKLVKQGDILYALYGATSGEVERSKINGAINQAILAIIPNENYDAEFISQWLKNNKENIVNLYLQGGQGNLSGEIVKKIEISFPTKKEQTAIGNFFRQLDETIALQTAEVEKLNQLKKGLLAAMLV